MPKLYRYLLFVFVLIYPFFGLLSKPSANEILAMEKKLTVLINKERQKRGLPPLKEWRLLYQCAHEHSANMAKNKVAFGHKGFEKRATKVNEKTKIAAFGENLAYFFGIKNPLENAVLKWMESPTHRANILDPKFRETAIAIVQDKKEGLYITQLFAIRL